MQIEGLNIDGLPSNTHKFDLLKGTNFIQLEKEGAFDSHQANGIPLLNNLNLVLKLNYYRIKRSCSIKSDSKCCRDINYYLDLVTAFIKKSNYDNTDKQGLIDFVETYWKDTFEKRDYDCKRDLDEEAVRKRSILKQLYDYCDDKNYIEKKELQYNEYLNTKWDKIISYTNSNHKYLYYNIKYENINKKVNYKDLLLNTADFPFINCKDLKNYDITFSDVKTINEIPDAVSVAHPVASGGARRSEDSSLVIMLGAGEDVSSRSSFAGHTYHNTVSEPGFTRESGEKDGEDEARTSETATPMWQTPLSAGVSTAGVAFFFFFLYKTLILSLLPFSHQFSPVGQWISTLIRRDTSMRKDMYEDEPLLILNHPEQNDHHISYHSISH
ncbi:PIR protein [Plasmodium ovale]|uniref:PIR protein n=1 Tax=Plasmodium ovale TaxID=36330 RepID=A0A1D3JFL4_PLAOA|nr:PIR protein [Plasmodium ovale]